MILIDTHCHLDEDAFASDRDEIVARAVAGGVRTMITIGTTAASSREATQIAARYPHVYAVVGIQPNYAAEAAPGDFETIERLAGAPKVVAIGETGLDRYWDHAPFELQQDYFTRHVELARRLDLPFVVHCREAEADVVSQLRKLSAGVELRGVMHSFSGDAATAQACLELGLHISFAGMVTFRRNDELRAVAAGIPDDRLLIETDAPYLAPTPHRGKRNEPAHVLHTAKCLAEVRGVPPERLAEQTTANARRLFRLPEAPDA